MTEIVVVVTGALDGDAVDRLAGDLDEAVRQRPGRLVVDLSACSRLDAAAIVVLLKIHGQMLQAYGALVLRHPRDRVRRALRLARVDQVLEVDESNALVVAR